MINASLPPPELMEQLKEALSRSEFRPKVQPFIGNDLWETVDGQSNQVI